MWLTADQELRREFLLFALGKQPDVEAAITMAARMERFVLDGQPVSDGRPYEVEPAEVAAAMTEAGVATGPAPRQAYEHQTHDQQTHDQQPHDQQPPDQQPKVTKRRWSDADDARLRELWQSSECALEEIAEELERTVPSLYSRARALGMEKRGPMTKARQEPAAAAPDVGPAAELKAVEPKEEAEPEEPAQQATVQEEPVPAVTVQETPAQESPIQEAPVQEAPVREEAGDGSAGEDGKAAEAAAGKSVVLSPNARRQVMPRERHRFSAGGDALQTGRPRHGFGRKTIAAASSVASPMFVDSIIQFLRSRDYSVVRVGDGQFRLDGRRVMTADELREKANQVRKSLGQAPFTSQLDKEAS